MALGMIVVYRRAGQLLQELSCMPNEKEAIHPAD
jgi:hypothetical protein